MRKTNDEDAIIELYGEIVDKPKPSFVYKTTAILLGIRTFAIVAVLLVVTVWLLIDSSSTDKVGEILLGVIGANVFFSILVYYDLLCMRKLLKNQHLGTNGQKLISVIYLIGSSIIYNQTPDIILFLSFPFALNLALLVFLLCIKTPVFEYSDVIAEPVFENPED